MGIPILGSSGTVAEIEAGTKTLRTTLRPTDVGALGYYSIAPITSSMSAGLAANSPIVSMRWTDSTLCVITKILLQAVTTGTGFTAGIAIFDLFMARSFTVSDSGGSAFNSVNSFYTHDQQLRTNMGPSLFLTTNTRAATFSSLTAGTRTLDATPISSINGPASATIQTSIISSNGPNGAMLWDNRTGEYPLVLAQNEGIVIQASVPATGTWQFSFHVNWFEIASY